MNQQRSNFVRFARGLRAGLGLISILLQVATATWVVFEGTTKNINMSSTTYGGAILGFSAVYGIFTFVAAFYQVFMQKYWQISFSAAVLGIALAFMITRTGQQMSIEGFDFESIDNAFGVIMLLLWIYAGALWFAVDGVLVMGYRIVKWIINL